MFGVTRKKPRGANNNRRRIIKHSNGSDSSDSEEEDHAGRTITSKDKKSSQESHRRSPASTAKVVAVPTDRLDEDASKDGGYDRKDDEQNKDDDNKGGDSDDSSHSHRKRSHKRRHHHHDKKDSSKKHKHKHEHKHKHKHKHKEKHHDHEKKVTNEKERHHKKSKSKKKIGNATFLSFDPDDVGEDHHYDEDVVKEGKGPKKRKKHSDRSSKTRGGTGMGMGFGYGGAAMALSHSSEEEDEEDSAIFDGDGGAQNQSHDSTGQRFQRNKNNNTDEGERGSSLYDKAALEKLKREQKTRLGPKVDTVTTENVGTMDVDGHADAKEKEGAINRKAQKEEKEEEEEEFISLSGKPSTNKSIPNEPIVLTGDDAMAYVNEDDDDNEETFNNNANTGEFDHGLQCPPTPSKDATKSMAKDLENNPPSQEMEEDNRQWEDGIARRAGVLPASSAMDRNDISGSTHRKSRRTHHHVARDNSQNSSSLSSSIAQIKTSLQPTIQNLKTISADLQTSLHRHKSNVESAHDELKQHQNTLETHGKSLEYYQLLREDLAIWMGALRELKTMVDLANEAKDKWEGDITWRKREKVLEWGEDVMDVLEKKGLLQKKIMGGGETVIVGPGADGNGASGAQPTVDEFGRDLSSMATMARTKRWERRRQIFHERRNLPLGSPSSSPSSLEQGMKYTNDDNIPDEEISDWKQRHQALNDATALVPMMVKEEYLSISNLCNLFFEWERLHPEDYKRCYAEMTLVQLISVLVHLENCEKWDILGMNDGLENVGGDDDAMDVENIGSSQSIRDVSKFQWFFDLKDAISKRENAASNNVLMKVIQKCIVPRFLSVLTIEESEDTMHGVYDPFSPQQTNRLCSFFKSLLECLSASSDQKDSTKQGELAENVAGALVTLLKNCMDEMTVPIVKTSDVATEADSFVPKNGVGRFDNETADAIAYSTTIQAKSLRNLVANFLIWLPLLDESLSPSSKQEKLVPFAQIVFMDLIAVRLLPVIESMREIGLAELATKLIVDVCRAAEMAGLMEKSEFMIFAAPLRLAAQNAGIHG